MIQNLYFPDMIDIVDSHCHLDFEDFDNDRDLILKRAKDKNVKYFLSISINMEDFDKVYSVAKSSDNIWCTTGIHPNNVSKEKLNLKKLSEDLKINLKKTKVIGLGETGLDFFRGDENKKNQIESFYTHLELSGILNYPTIVHTRNADSETISCIKNSVNKFSSTGLIHCFTSTKYLAKEVLNKGFYISFSGIITFKSASDLIEVVKYVPLDRILVETDAPYLAPIPHRGKRNEPSFVSHTIEKVAEIKKVSTQKMAEITTNNFFNLFSKTNK